MDQIMSGNHVSKRRIDGGFSIVVILIRVKFGRIKVTS